MDLSELLKKHMVQKIESDVKRAAELLEHADNDLNAAKDNLKAGHCDWTLAISYNGFLQVWHLCHIRDIEHILKHIILQLFNSVLQCFQKNLQTSCKI